MVTSPTAQLSLPQSVGSTRLTWRHWVYFALIFCLLLTDGMDVTISSHIFPTLIDEWGVSVGGGIALVVSGGFIAMAIGAFAGGRLADRWGRKFLLVLVGLLFSGATALGGTATDFTMFALWRLLACLGIGAVLPTAMTLLADLVPENRRGAMVAAAYAGLGLGTTVGAALAAAILPEHGWRVLLVIGGVLPLLFTALVWIVIPESPTFLVSRGQALRARRSLARLDPQDDAVLPESASGDPAEPSSGVTRRLLSPRFVRTTLLLWVFGFLSLGTQLLLIQYLPILLQLPTPGLTSVQSSTIVAFYGLASVVSLLLLGLVLARWNHFPVIGICLSLAAVIAIVVGLTQDAGFGTLLIVLTAAGFLIPAALGPTRNILAVESYPTPMRATGMGMTELSARVGSAGCGAVGGVLIGAGMGLGGVFFLTLVPLGILGTALMGLKAADRRMSSPHP